MSWMMMMMVMMTMMADASRRIGQRNGMRFCMSGICAWITGFMPVEFHPGQKGA